MVAAGSFHSADQCNMILGRQSLQSLRLDLDAMLSNNPTKQQLCIENLEVALRNLGIDDAHLVVRRKIPLVSWLWNTTDAW